MRIPDATPALEGRGLCFSYRAPVVQNLSLRLEYGTVTGIIGPNGSGKTTVLRLLSGTLRPSAGSVLIHGTLPVASMKRKEIARHIAMAPQAAGHGSLLTVMEFALLGRSPHLPGFGFESARDEEIATEALEMTRMIPLRDARVCELSGGERQRLLLARALVQRSKVLLLDELTANLDINYQIELMGLVRRLTRERHLATLVVSHEIQLLAEFADRIALMSAGVIHAQGDVAEVLTRENLNLLFGMDFQIRRPADGRLEILPGLMER